MARRRGKRWAAEGYDPATKQKRHLSTHDTRKQASAAEAKWQLRHKLIGAETCGQFAARWVEDYPRREESTNLHNAERISWFARDFKNVRLADVDRPTARRWALENPKRLKAVRAMFGDAMRDGLTDINPFSNLRLPGSRGRRDIVVMTEPELHEFAGLAFRDEMRLGEYATEYRALVLFAGYVGLRPGELFALRRTDLQGEFAQIVRAYNSVTKVTGPTKTHKNRKVIIPPPAAQALQTVPWHESGLVFESLSGNQLTLPSHRHYWERLTGLAGRKMDFYETRHTAATFLAERGARPADVGVQLGHPNGILAEELYCHPSQDNARARLLASWAA